MPNSAVCFRHPINDSIQDILDSTDPGIKKVVDALRNDPKIQVGGKTINIGYTYDDFVLLHPAFRNFLDRAPRESWHQKYATKEYQKEIAENLDNNRDHYRDFDYPDIEDPQIPGNANAKDATKHVLAKANGMILGNEHTDQHTKDLLVNAVDAGDVEMLFIEEFKVSMQPILEEYLSGDSDDFPPLLDDYITKFKTGKGVDFGPLLKKAKEKGAKVYGIDSGDAHLMEDSDPRHHEDRCASMHVVSEKVMKEAIKNNPNKKFVALCGAAHSNTHEGGIPGLSQIMNVPAVTLGLDGKMKFHEEDQTLRVMPPKEEQMFADRFALELAAKYKELDTKYQEPNKIESLDMTELRLEAAKIAKKLKTDGKLTSVKDIDKALKAPETAEAKNALILRTASRSVKRKNMRKLIAAGDSNKLMEALNRFKAEDPYGFKNEHEKTGTTLLHHAAELGQTGCIEELVTQMNYDLEARDSGADNPGMTPLQRAAAFGQAQAVQKLIQKGADVNAKTTKNNLTALHLAAKKDSATALELLNNGAQVDAKDEKNKTPLHYAVENDNGGAVGHLIAKNADLNLADEDGNRPVHLAAKLDLPGIIDSLATAGANLDLLNKEGDAPLHIALGTGKKDAAQKLLVKNANATLANAKGSQPIHLAAERGNGAALDYLVDTKGVNLDTADNGGKTPFDLAIESGQAPLIGNVLTRKNKANLTQDLVARFLHDAKQKHTAEKGEKDPDLDDRELNDVGTMLAATLIKANVLTAKNKLNDCANSNEYKKAIEDVIKRTKERAAKFTSAKNALKDNSQILLRNMLKEDPGLKYYVDPTDGTNLGHWGGRFRNAAGIDMLVDVGVDFTIADKNGETAVHHACKDRYDDAHTQTQQANAVAMLARRGVNLDVQNKKNQTAMHLAAWNGNAKALDKLFAGNANANLRDDRNWTALDVAIASTKKEAEASFYRANKDPNNDLITGNPKSTIDILCDATLCEDPNHLTKVREAYEYMYADPKLRPILDLAALDASGNRQPPGGGVRIVIANDENTGQLWNAAGVGKVGARGAFDHEANVVMVAAKKSGTGLATKEDFAGCLAHEMTHLATRIVFGQEVSPFGENEHKKKQEYIDSITDVVKKTNLLCKSNPIDKDIHDRVSGRMDHYVGKGNADHELLMEHIVSVPQLMAMYGEDNLGDKLGSLKDFYEKFLQDVEQAKSAPKFLNARAKIDTAANQNLARTLKVTHPRPPVEEGWTGDQKDGSTELAVDEIISRIEKNLHCELGTLTPPKEAKATIAWKVDNFQITDPETAKEIEKRMVKVRKTLQKTLGDGGLPPSMSVDEYARFIESTAKLVKNTTANDIDDAINTKAKDFLRDNKVKYVEHQIAKGGDIAPEHLAEAILLKAEEKAGAGSATDVSSSDHKKAVAVLTKQLGNLDQNVLADPGKLLDQLSDVVAKGKGGGVYQKKPNKSDKVTIDVKTAKKAWLSKLKEMSV